MKDTITLKDGREIQLCEDGFIRVVGEISYKMTCEFQRAMFETFVANEEKIAELERDLMFWQQYCDDISNEVGEVF